MIILVLTFVPQLYNICRVSGLKSGHLAMTDLLFGQIDILLYVGIEVADELGSSGAEAVVLDAEDVVLPGTLTSRKLTRTMIK